MNIVTLLLGFFLPWVAAFLALRTLEGRLGLHSHLARQLGCSYFLGLLALHATLSSWEAATDELVVYPVLLLFAGAAALGGIALTLSRSSGSQVSAPLTIPDDRMTSSGWRRAAFWCLLLLALAHLTLAGLEAINRPIFPWDAWQTWMYRAKAWFLYGKIFPFVSALDWQESGKVLFNAPGHDYPTFTSVMALWAALSLGSWSETLVNTPVALCGIALALALYGHCRECNWSRLTAIVTVFLFLSVPLLGTHLSLAGQADIWMLGFSGLGYVSVIRGLAQPGRYQLFLGLLLCALAIFVKNEGIVWFFGACAIVAIVKFPRICAIAGLTCVAAFAATVLVGTGTISLPILGEVGYRGGELYLSQLGAVPVNQYSVLDDYIDHLFLKGSWNLLWYLVFASAIAALFLRNLRLRITVLAFYLVIATSQVVIFGVTEHGRWAEDGTALNRLLLQLLPAWIFCLAYVFNSLCQQQAATATPTRTIFTSLKAGLASTLIVAIFTAAGLSLLLDKPRAGAMDFQSRLFPVVGHAKHQNRGIEIVDYQDGIAILSGGTTHIDSSALTMLEVTLKGSMRKAAGFFWRRKDMKDTVESVTIGKAGKHIIDLSQLEGWQDTITEVGIIAYENGDNAPVSIRRLALKPRTVRSTIAETWSDWTAQEYWSQASVNWLAGGRRDQAVTLPMIASAWLACACLIAALLPSVPSSRKHSIAVLIVTAWALADSRWMANSVTQAGETIAYYNDNSKPTHLDFELDSQLAVATTDAKAKLNSDTSPVIVTAAERNRRFKVLRAKYWLLPHPTLAVNNDLEELSKVDAESLIYLDLFILEPGDTYTDEARLKDSVTRLIGDDFWEKALKGNFGYVFER